MHRHPRSSKIQSTTPRFTKPSHHEHNWIRTIPDIFPDIMRAPAVTYKSERDDTRIKSNKYIAFARPYKGKQGLLMIGSQQRPMLIDESQPDHVKVLPMRLDREAITDTWIFTLSLYEAEGLIQLEDCIVSNGESIRSTKTFKERFAKLQKFADTTWFRDPQFQLNWNIQVADTYSLADIGTAATGVNGGYICLMPDSPTYRLLKVLPAVSPKHVVEGGPQSFLCVGVEGKPDVYDLKRDDGSQVGRASIQALSISLKLQEKRSTGETMRVMAEWNEDFESYIVTSVL